MVVNLEVKSAFVENHNFISQLQAVTDRFLIVSFSVAQKKKIVYFSLTIENLTLIKVLIVDGKKNQSAYYFIY